MLDTTRRTHPRSYSQPFQSGWTAACATRRTELGRTVLVRFDVDCSVPHGFIAKHPTKRSPTGVIYGLCQPCPCQTGHVDITDSDQPIFTNQSGRNDVQIVSTPVGDTSVNRTGLRLAPSSLRAGQPRGVLPQMTRILNLFTRRERGERGQPEVDADFARSAVGALFDLDLQIQIPSAARILRKTASLNPSQNGSRQPEPIPTTQIHNRVTPHLNGAILKRNPTERFLPAPTWSATKLMGRLCELSTDRRQRIGMQSDVARTSNRQSDQLKRRRLGSHPSFREPMRFSAKVPDLTHSASHTLKRCRAVGVFKSVPIGQNQQVIIPLSCAS
jgi:hypothetical protein